MDMNQSQLQQQVLQRANPTAGVVQGFQDQVNQQIAQPELSPAQQAQLKEIQQGQMQSASAPVAPPMPSEMGATAGETGVPTQTEEQQQMIGGILDSPSPFDMQNPTSVPTVLGADDLQKHIGLFETLTGTLQDPSTLPQSFDADTLGRYVNLIDQVSLGNQGTAELKDFPEGFERQNGYGYLAGQCTAFASWYLRNRGIDLQKAGNAKSWPQAAAKAGLDVSETPKVGSVVVWPTLGQYGHVAVVDSVNPDGTINVSEQNYKPGQYTQRSNVSTKGTVYIDPVATKETL